MGSNMVVNTKYTPNPDLKFTGNGIFDDIETNLMDICKRALEQCRMLSLEFKNLELEMKCSPQFVDFQNVPALFCWCSGSNSEYKELGGFSGKRINMVESYHCNVFYCVAGRDPQQTHQALRVIGSIFQEALIKNLNLNDLVDGPSEYVSTTFTPKPVVFNKEFIPISNVTCSIIYRKLNTSEVYSNALVPTF